MAYDSARAVTVLFGGHDGAYNGETWEWNGTAWSQKVAPGPSPRTAHVMVYDQFRGVTVLFGGFDGSYLDDTWEWDGVSWTQPVMADTVSDGRVFVRRYRAIYELHSSSHDREHPVRPGFTYVDVLVDPRSDEE
jgi:hypothetical protein